MDRGEAARLVARAKDGDAEAFARLERQYGAMMEKIARGVVLDGIEPEDVLVEMRLGLWHAVRLYEESRGAAFGTTLHNWLRSYADGMIRSRRTLRNEALNLATSIETPLHKDRTIADTLAAPEDDGGAEMRSRFAALADVLPPDLRLTLAALIEMDGSRTLAAERLGVSTQTVDNRRAKIRAVAAEHGLDGW